MNDEVRSTYKELDAEQLAKIGKMKAAAQEFIDVLKAERASREMSLAITNAEQAVMWATKGMT